MESDKIMKTWTDPPGFPPSGFPLQFCEPGTGDSPLCDIRAVLEILRSAGYEGPLCLELDGGGEPQRPAKESARMSLEFMRG